MRSTKLLKFTPNQHYRSKYDELILDKDGNSAIYVELKQTARELISQYYSNKYRANILFPVESKSSDFTLYSSVTSFQKKIKQHLKDAKQEYDGDCRIAFFLGASWWHATPIIYIKENGREGILYADSLGSKPELANLIAQESRIPVYAIPDQRQRDLYSCYTDALLFGRDTTAINFETGDYYIPNLLQFLESHAKKRDWYYTTILPDELLKTSQLSSFTFSHHEKNPTEKIIHIHKNNPETLEQFRNRFSLQNATLIPAENEEILYGAKVKKDVTIATYLRDKSTKLADVVEIQFYCNQMNEILGNTFSGRMLFNFIETCKKILREQGSLIPKQQREGLYDFVVEYLSVFKSRIDFNPKRNPNTLFQPTRKYGINYACINSLLEGIQNNSEDAASIKAASKLIAQLKGASHTLEKVPANFIEDDYQALHTGWLKKIIDVFPAASLIRRP